MGIVDRVDELATIRALLLTDEVRLLTLTGPGGVGKTRLALEAGRNLAQHFVDGVIFVDLSSVRDPGLVVEALLRNLGANDDPADESVPKRLDALRDRALLIILDNAEQVLPGASHLAELLLAAPRVTLLVTSREALHLRWEYIFPILPLALPNLQQLSPPEKLAEIPSIALFLHRARAINPDFALAEENARAVAELVAHLDGLPLAIELAAARTPLLTPLMILERLGQRLSLLRWQAHDLPQRQQTLGSAIAWSYDLLSSEEQTLFRHLGIFAGSFSLRAVEAIAASAVNDPLESLASLVDKSMVQVYGRDQDNVRYVLLESMRAYARERLAEVGELEEAGHTHALYYLALAERAEPELTGSEQQIWIARLEWAHDNLRAALRWLLDHNEGELALCLTTTLGHFWETQGYLAEGSRLLDEALARTPAADPPLRAKGLSCLGTLLARTVSEGEDSNQCGEVERAKMALDQAVALAHSLEDPLTLARSLTALGMLGLTMKEWDQARHLLGRARASWQEAHHPRGLADTLLHLGTVELMHGNYQEAARLAEESAANYCNLGDESARTVALLVLLTATGAPGEVAMPGVVMQELLALSEGLATPPLRALWAAGIAWLFRERADPERLGRLLGAADAMPRTRDPAERALLRAYVAAASETLRARIGQDAFNAALAKGRSLSCEQMLREVFRVAAPGKCAAKRSQSTVLSPREQEVLQLVAQGLSNKRIAKEVFVAPSTVAYYLTSIYNKLGVDTRTGAVAAGAQRGLVLLGPET